MQWFVINLLGSFVVFAPYVVTLEGSQPKVKHEREVGWKNVLKFKHNPTRLQERVLTLQVVFPTMGVRDS
jgi:hypothetical protein